MKTFIQLFILLFFILFTTTLHSQKENYNWYFGIGNGITFNTNNLEPIFLQGNALAMDETSCAIISDSEGYLRYYSYNSKLLNALGDLLASNDKIIDHTRSVQNDIMVKINNTTTIRIATNAFQEGLNINRPTPLTYNIIKENEFNTYVSQSIIIKEDYKGEAVFVMKDFLSDSHFLLTNDRNEKVFSLYKYDDKIESYILKLSYEEPKTEFIFDNYIRTYLKSNLQCSKFIRSFARGFNSQNHFFDLFDINLKENNIDFIKRIDLNRYKTKYFFSTGAFEFSPNGRFFYTSAQTYDEKYDLYYEDLLQYSILEDTIRIVERINVTDYIINTSGTSEFGTLYSYLIGPNMKIYVSNWHINYLSVINKPNLVGDKSDFQRKKIEMQEIKSGDALPNIPTSYFLRVNSNVILSSCQGDSVQLRAIAQYHNFPDTNYVWTGPNGFYSEEQNPILMDLSPADEGVYKVKVFGGETIDSGETYVQVFPTPEPRIEAHPSTFSCDGEAITLVADEDYGSYLWSTGETTKSIEVSEAGEYYLTIEDENACIGSTSIAVGFGGDIFILGDTLICQGESTILSAGDDFTEYLWSTGETTKSIEVSEAGKYTLKIKTEEGCEAEASINVSYHPEVIAELRSHEQELCYGESVDLVSRYDLPHWEMRWSTGEEGKEIKVIESGLYKLYIEDLETGCKDSTETQIWIEEEITAGIQGANICEGEETELIAEPQGEDYSYVWSTGETTSSIKVIESGNYSVKISKGKCESEAEIEIEVYPMPELAIVGEREICQGETTILSANEDYESYEWSTGERTKSIEAKGGEYSLRVWTEDGCSITESVIVKEKSSEIEFESLVYDFGKVYLTETRDTIIEGRNISENDIIIETQIINPEDYYRIDYSLNPQTTGPYREIIELRVEEPCPRTYQIELLAEIYTRVKLSAPELEVEIGESDLRIPYYIESETNLGEKNFTAQVEISKEVYHTEDPYTVIKSHNIQIDKTEFHSQTGIVLLASLEEYPISFSNINFEDPYIEIEEDPGLLILNEICIHDARLIELIEPTKAYVSPNPAGESLKVRIESEERGEIEIELLDASGMRVYAQRLTNSRAEINIPTKSFSSGVYILKINTARAHLEKRIMIVR